MIQTKRKMDYVRPFEQVLQEEIRTVCKFEAESGRKR